jgi:hypothetical protein
VAYGLTRQQADQLGAWWEERRSIIQPAEFVLDQQDNVVSSTYSSGPIGRVDAADVIKHIKFRDAQALKK